MVGMLEDLEMKRLLQARAKSLAAENKEALMSLISYGAVLWRVWRPRWDDVIHAWNDLSSNQVACLAQHRAIIHLGLGGV